MDSSGFRLRFLSYTKTCSVRQESTSEDRKSFDRTSSRQRIGLLSDTGSQGGCKAQRREADPPAPGGRGAAGHRGFTPLTCASRCGNKARHGQKHTGECKMELGRTGIPWEGVMEEGWRGGGRDGGREDHLSGVSLPPPYWGQRLLHSKPPLGPCRAAAAAPPVSSWASSCFPSPRAPLRHCPARKPSSDHVLLRQEHVLGGK
ncbi:uncharacterized protein LOC121073592 isoform X3 [Cygnus olor]|uniref:uncharacterized protein LOC121073592 isoform X3 n=1 Tax=Cygnus olor TaxID=8869 RepID=UPI001ADE9E0B|nr:uncharacterized protein LOC121073592 isoform X3 [Cygnus olor]